MTIAINTTSFLKSSNVYYRPLTADDYKAYKELRCAALSSEDARSFVKGDKPEENRTDAEWKNVCTETFDQKKRGKTVAIGAFYHGEQGEKLVGSALAERWDGDKTGNTAYYRAIYVLPEFRKGGVGEKIERLLDVWAIKHGYLRSLFTVRADKDKWLQRQISVFGGEIADTKMIPYANGEMSLTHYLARDLVSSKQVEQATRTAKIVMFGQQLPVAIAA